MCYAWLVSVVDGQFLPDKPAEQQAAGSSEHNCPFHGIGLYLRAMQISTADTDRKLFSFFFFLSAHLSPQVKCDCNEAIRAQCWVSHENRSQHWKQLLEE